MHQDELGIWTSCFFQLPQVGPIDKFHDEEMKSLNFAEFMDRDDVGMR